METTTQMPIASALALNAECVAHVLHTTIGGSQPPPLVLLIGATLAEMIQARDMVRGLNQADEAKATHVTCDDRVLAALYTLLHYDEDKNPDGSYRAALAAAGKAVVICRTVS